MKPLLAYSIAIGAGGLASGLSSWLVTTDPTFAPIGPIVVAVAGAFLSSLIIGSALRGSFIYMRSERTPLSTKERWIWVAIGAVVVIGFAIVMTLAMPPYEPR